MRFRPGFTRARPDFTGERPGLAWVRPGAALVRPGLTFRALATGVPFLALGASNASARFLDAQASKASSAEAAAGRAVLWPVGPPPSAARCGLHRWRMPTRAMSPVLLGLAGDSWSGRIFHFDPIRVPPAQCEPLLRLSSRPSARARLKIALTQFLRDRRRC